MVPTESAHLFKKGSKTFFTSSIFFPKSTREEITILYGFVRKADDLVDQIPQDKKGFHAFVASYRAALKGKPVSDPVIKAFVTLAKEKQFPEEWTESFLSAMEQDLSIKQYATIVDTQRYIYGSADVIGLFVAKILKLPKEAYATAQMLGKSFQFLNFIRDVQEDVELGRQYFPSQDLEKFGLSNLSQHEIQSKPDRFKKFMTFQLSRYTSWQDQAEAGFKYLPKKYLVPIKTASDLYKWTASVIAHDPFIVYQKKVKPTKVRILWTVVKNVFFL
ncbi:phytoene/squalene synthase family protein [Candidatus Woesebacteria bacterium]|nr:phytoene/squalene synthase family protein [Candidatus Woesebacteria bacterium]